MPQRISFLSVQKEQSVSVCVEQEHSSNPKENPQKTQFRSFDFFFFPNKWLFPLRSEIAFEFVAFDLNE